MVHINGILMVYGWFQPHYLNIYPATYLNQSMLDSAHGSHHIHQLDDQKTDSVTPVCDRPDFCCYLTGG